MLLGADFRVSPTVSSRVPALGVRDLSPVHGNELCVQVHISWQAPGAVDCLGIADGPALNGRLPRGHCRGVRPGHHPSWQRSSTCPQCQKQTQGSCTVRAGEGVDPPPPNGREPQVSLTAQAQPDPPQGLTAGRVVAAVVALLRQAGIGQHQPILGGHKHI